MTRKTLDFSIRRSGRVALDFSDLVPTVTNDPPVATSQSLTTPYETALAFTLTGTDPDAGDTLTYTVIGTPDFGVLSGTAPNLTYTPQAGYDGFESILFEVSDGELTDQGVITIQVEEAPLTLESLPNKELLFDASYDGGRHPAALASEAQNTGISSGDNVNTLPDWSENNRHAERLIGQLTWVENSGDDAMYVATGEISYRPDDGGTYAPYGQAFTLYYLLQDKGDSGSSATGSGGTPGVRRSSSGELEWIQDGSLAFPDVELMATINTAKHLLTVAQDATGVSVRFDGEIKFSSTDPAPDYADSLFRIGAREGNSSRWNHDFGQLGLYSSRHSLADIVAAESLIASKHGLSFSSALQIDAAENQVFQRQASGGGTIRRTGTYVAASVSGVKVRFNGGAWQTATLDPINETWSIEYTSADEVWGLLEVWSTDDQYKTSTIVGIGDIDLVIGQSNVERITGVSGMPTYTGGRYGVYRWQKLDYVSVVDRWWHTQYAERAEADSAVPRSSIIVSVGSSGVGDWLKDTGVHYGKIEQALLDAQGITGPYVAGTHGKLFKRVLVGFGERDMELGTSAATMQSNVETFSGSLNTDYAADEIRWSRPQVVNIAYASTANQAAVRSGIDAAVAGIAYIMAGPDLEALTTPTQWTGTNGVHPATVAELDALGNAWADAVGIA